MIRKLLPEDIHKGYLILVNADFPYQEVVQKPLTTLFHYTEDNLSCDRSIATKAYWENCLLERRASSVLSSLLQKIEAGSQIMPISGYRSVAEQTRLYRDSIIENGEAFTKQFVAKPNHSEHHTGLAIDLAIYQDNIDIICPDFPRDGIAGEFRRLAAEYGFIERYREGKEKITGISAEPWHFRYVGHPHAEIMDEKNLSLEEYIEFVKGFTYPNQSLLRKRSGYQTEISYLPLNQPEILLELPEDKNYEISGNNVDGFILTIWERTDSSV